MSDKHPCLRCKYFDRTPQAVEDLRSFDDEPLCPDWAPARKPGNPFFMSVLGFALCAALAVYSIGVFLHEVTLLNAFLMAFAIGAATSWGIVLMKRARRK